MDNAAKVAEVAWKDLYFFKTDHKNGYQHVPIHESSESSLECSGDVFIMFLQSFHLDGSPALWCIIP